MEQISPFLSPGFLVTVAIATIGFVAWLLRLEAKENTNEKNILKLDQAMEDTWKDLEGHKSNDGIHFSQRLATEVDRRQSDRFGRVEADLAEIKGIVKELAKR